MSASGNSQPKTSAEIANRVNLFLSRALPLLTPLGVALGVFFPEVFTRLRPSVFWLFATITLSGSLTISTRDLGKTITSPFPIFIFIFTVRIIMPLIVFFISRLIFKGDQNTIAGYILVYAVPTAVLGFVWTSIFKGDPALSLALILLDTLLAPLVVPGTIKLLLGTSISLDMTGMIISLILMVVIPTILGVTFNELSRGKIPAMINPYLSPFSKICMVMVIAANSAAVAPQIRLDNPRLWIITAATIGFTVFGFVFAKFTSIISKLDNKKHISLFFASSLRNTSAAMTLGTQFFPPAAALPAILGIVFQQTTASIMGRIFLGKIPDDTNTKASDKTE